jgi:hypothetical protein
MSIDALTLPSIDRDYVGCRITKRTNPVERSDADRLAFTNAGGLWLIREIELAKAMPPRL